MEKINLADVELVTDLNRKEIKQLMANGLTKREIFNLKDILNSEFEMDGKTYKTIIEYSRTNKLPLFSIIKQNGLLSKNDRMKLTNNSKLKESKERNVEIFGFYNGEKYSIKDLATIKGVSYSAMLESMNKNKRDILKSMK